MKDTHTTLQKIKENIAALDMLRVKKVLLLYELKLKFIGDSCNRLNKLKYFSEIFNQATIGINFVSSQQNGFYYNTLLKNNPYLDTITELEWGEINFEQYDIVIALTANETGLLDFLHEKYGQRIASGEFRPVVFSVSQAMIQQADITTVFPVNTALVEYFRTKNPPGELYISEEEQAWGNQWLESKGVRKQDKLFIFLDSTSSNTKLVNLNVYFEVLTELLRQEDVKVLVFDERGLGKEDFYLAWLGDSYRGRLIFSKQLTLREDLSIIGSVYTKLMFGPCTGLIHCASSIFNYFLRMGMRREELPLLVTYTGRYDKDGGTAELWWGNAPLVNCLLLKKKDNRKEIFSLHDLTHEERQLNDQLPCSEYSSELLLAYLQRQLTAAVEIA